MYCRVLNWMLTDVSEVRAASIIRAMSDPYMYPMKVKCTATRHAGAKGEGGIAPTYS
jgi:hypothetical protein